MKLTDDIRPDWEEYAKELLNVIRRLQSASRTGGCAILTLRMAVNEDGKPLCWASPEVVKLEPKASCHVDELLALLAGK